MTSKCVIGFLKTHLTLYFGTEMEPTIMIIIGSDIFQTLQKDVVIPRGLEPLTFGLGIRRSIQLNYGTTHKNIGITDQILVQF